MASGHLRVPHQQAGHMAAPTSSALPSKNPLPTGSRPHMAKSRHPAARNRCPLYPQERTFRGPRLTSAFDPKPTSRTIDFVVCGDKLTVVPTAQTNIRSGPGFGGQVKQMGLKSQRNISRNPVSDRRLALSGDHENSDVPLPSGLSASTRLVR